MHNSVHGRMDKRCPAGCNDLAVACDADCAADTAIAAIPPLSGAPPPLPPFQPFEDAGRTVAARGYGSVARYNEGSTDMAGQPREAISGFRVAAIATIERLAEHTNAFGGVAAGRDRTAHVALRAPDAAISSQLGVDGETDDVVGADRLQQIERRLGTIVAVAVHEDRNV